MVRAYALNSEWKSNDQERTINQPERCYIWICLIIKVDTKSCAISGLVYSGLLHSGNKVIHRSQLSVGQISALCVYFGAQPWASNLEKKGGKLCDKVQHNGVPTPKCTPQWLSRKHSQQCACIWGSQEGYARSCGDTVSHCGSELSASDITGKLWLSARLGAARSHIQRHLSACMCVCVWRPDLLCLK